MINPDARAEELLDRIALHEFRANPPAFLLVSAKRTKR
jgi:hypothetical protein